MIDELNALLKELQPISLKEMEAVALMNRTDTKYIFHVSNLMKLLPALQQQYRVLHIEDKAVLTYHTLYYDTPDYGLYYMHHNGLANRCKVRHRTYVDSALGFLELKEKTNKGRTIKNRVKTGDQNISQEKGSKLFESSGLKYQTADLVPKIQVNYKRITLVNVAQPERVTLDVFLEVVNGNQHLHFDFLAIAEVKRSAKSISPFIRSIQKLHIQQASFSKYCMGVALSEPDVKKNNFKKIILKLNKIEQAAA